MILENVRNLADNEANWDVIKKELMERDFVIMEKPLILSPHQFGIPQVRERVYILGIKKEFKNDKVLTNGYIHREDLKIEKFMVVCRDDSVAAILDDAEIDAKYFLPTDLVRVLDAWADFKAGTQMGITGKPIWMTCFGIGIDDTEVFRQQLGYYSDKVDKDGYVEFDELGKPRPLFPAWKKHFVDFSRSFYLEHREFIDDWLIRHNMPAEIKLHNKFEWNCGTFVDNIKNGITQIRQSGVRVKRPNYFPSLVAMRNTPIIWDVRLELYRYITPHEAAKLQSFDEGIQFHENDNETYKQLGNSVNVRIIEILAERLFKLGHWRKTAK